MEGDEETIELSLESRTLDVPWIEITSAVSSALVLELKENSGAESSKRLEAITEASTAESKRSAVAVTNTLGAASVASVAE